MLTLTQVKSYLNIDFADNDTVLQAMLDAAKMRAWSIIGHEVTDNPEVDNAIMADVASMYANRGEVVTFCDASTIVYRRYSDTPVL
jgi:uncharacterized phage protein (predicted DNA packaging)